MDSRRLICRWSVPVVLLLGLTMLPLGSSAFGQDVLFDTTVDGIWDTPGDELGWPVFGSGASGQYFGYNWIAGPAVPFDVCGSDWTVTTITVWAFGPQVVEGGGSQPESSWVVICPDDGGFPAPTAIWQSQVSGIDLLSSFVMTTSLVLSPGRYYVSMLPFESTTRVGWVQSFILGGLFKTIDSGLTWDQLGSPFADVALPAVRIEGEGLPSGADMTSWGLIKRLFQ